MMKYPRGLNKPAKLADETVFALSSIKRGAKTPAELLKGGIELCDYLIELLEKLESSEAKEGKLIFHSIRDDDKTVLNENRIDIGEVRKVKQWINDLMEDPSSHTSEEIEFIQNFLMTTTMPMWQNRTIEFRERKLKWGHIIRD